MWIHKLIILQKRPFTEWGWDHRYERLRYIQKTLRKTNPVIHRNISSCSTGFAFLSSVPHGVGLSPAATRRRWFSWRNEWRSLIQDSGPVQHIHYCPRHNLFSTIIEQNKSVHKYLLFSARSLLWTSRSIWAFREIVREPEIFCNHLSALKEGLTLCGPLFALKYEKRDFA